MQHGWFYNLLMGEGVAHSVVALSLVIFIGVLLSRLKIKGVGLGSTWVLFAGIALSHFGIRLDPVTLGFIKEFGLILFVYAIGFSVGPSFFSSFKKGGLALNMWATATILLACVCAYVIHKVTGTSLITMVGVMQGAVTNTPGLGAAQQTVSDAIASGAITPENIEEIVAGGETLDLAYAVAYPLGVVGIILSLLIIKALFNIKLHSETKKLDDDSASEIDSPEIIIVEVLADAPVVGKTIAEIKKSSNLKFVVSRLKKGDGTILPPTAETVLDATDKIVLAASKNDADKVVSLMGRVITGVDASSWNTPQKNLLSKRLIVTLGEVNGNTIGGLNIRKKYGVNITRVLRAGIAFVPRSNTQIFIGDTLVAVGEEEGINHVAALLGNSVNEYRKPHLWIIFLGMILGVVLGSLPIRIPGMPQVLKLGLAGGPLIVAILLGHFTRKVHLATQMTQSANLLLRELGMTFFLAAVGLGAGGTFVETLLGGGWLYVLYGIIITMLPIIIVGIVEHFTTKINFLTIMGMFSGATTDIPALAFANETAGNSYPAIGYATVYPLTMFLRILFAQIMVLIALA